MATTATETKISINNMNTTARKKTDFGLHKAVSVGMFGYFARSSFRNFTVDVDWVTS